MVLQYLKWWLWCWLLRYFYWSHFQIFNKKNIRNKGCEALLEIVNSQIMLYEIDQLETPTSVQELIDFGYLKKGQDTCPDHSKVVIVDGQAVSQ